MCAVKECVSKQRVDGLVELQNYNVMTERMKKIIVLIGEKKEQVEKAVFKEKDNSNFQPFRMAIDISNIEQFLWKYSYKRASFSASTMRDRFQ